MSTGTSGNRVFLVLIVFFALAMVATWFFSAAVVKRTREAAVRTDDALRIVAWAVLVHADVEQGRFPITDAELSATPYASSLDLTLAGTSPLASAGWPKSAETAGAGDELDASNWPERLGDALRWVSVQYQPHHDLPPTLTSGGHPTSQGVLDLVNGWVRAASDETARLRASANAPGTAPAE